MQLRINALEKRDAEKASLTQRNNFPNPDDKLVMKKAGSFSLIR